MNSSCTAMLPNKAQMDAVLAFLPELSSERFRFAEENAGPGAIPQTMPSKRATEFIAALSANGFILDFDWSSFAEQAKRIVADEGLLRRADLETICKILTTHVRADRFCDGVLAELHERGYLARILNRLVMIRTEMN